ncbi:MAG: WGR domain-containing protein [Proteobacteria bacterium]|nr:WGR domain-containing protein [Pseudomonadota bacterium]
MPRYEFSEGSSNKFWQIELKGKSFTTTYGKIGTDGQTTIKQFPSDADAKKEHDKLVAEKVKKGYELVGGKAAPKAAAPAKAAPAKAAKAAAPAKAGGKRYFEFSESSSNKFWEVFLDKLTVKTRYGKIGATGQLTIKEFADKASAQA